MDLLFRETYYSVVVSKKYAIPPHLIRVGQVCAALYPGDQNWHRAVIENVGDDDEEVEVIRNWFNTLITNIFRNVFRFTSGLLC